MGGARLGRDDGGSAGNEIPPQIEPIDLRMFERQSSPHEY